MLLLQPVSNVLNNQMNTVIKKGKSESEEHCVLFSARVVFKCDIAYLICPIVSLIVSVRTGKRHIHSLLCYNVFGLKY